MQSWIFSIITYQSSVSCEDAAQETLLLLTLCWKRYATYIFVKTRIQNVLEQHLFETEITL